jgi:hypothetical protein
MAESQAPSDRMARLDEVIRAGVVSAGVEIDGQEIEREPRATRPPQGT